MQIIVGLLPRDAGTVEVALPGYGPGRVIIDAAFSDHFHAWGRSP